MSKAADRSYASPADGGVFDVEHPNVSIKYPDEARGLFGVALKKDNEGIISA